MFEKPIVIVDIETTGASAKNSRILEIALLRMENGRVVKEFQSLVNPRVPVPSFITNLTGISNQDIEDAPYFDELAGTLNELFEDALFMAHHAVFDFSFVKKQMQECGYKFSPRMLCSVKLSRHLYPNVWGGHSLETIIKRHNITVSSRHRAYDDALAVHEFLRVVEAEHGSELFQEALKKQLRYKSLPTHFDESQLADIKNVPGVYIFKDESGTPVYIGKSVNVRTRVLSHFAQSTKESKELKISQNTHKLEVIETDSELEALLLESKLVKEMLPIYNRKLRRKREQTILRRVMNDAGYYQVEMVESNVAEFANPEEIFGVYDNRRKAKQSLQNARKNFDLCSKLLGLEVTKGKCFYSQLGKCKGACGGSESPELYNFRLDQAFERSRVSSWKYKKPVLLNTGQNSGIVVYFWKVIGKYVENPGSDPIFDKLDSPFEMDNYRILHQFISQNKQKVRVLDSFAT